MTRRMAPEMWPKEPWARSLRQTASIRALDGLGGRLSAALEMGGAELFIHRGHVDGALRHGDLAFPGGATDRERTRARALRLAECGAITVTLVASALSLPIGAALLFLLGPWVWLIYHLQVPGGPVPVSKSSWEYAGPRTDIHLAVQGVFFAVLLWGVLASEPGRHPMREIAYGCVAGSVAILLALTRFRHADRIAQRVSRNERDGLRRLIAIDAVVLRWDPPAP